MKKIILLIAVLLFIIPFSIAQTAQIPMINSYVTDNAGILSSTAKSQLENDLRELEKQTNGVQFVVYIENEYPKDYSLEEYTLKIAEANKIGKKGNDNGILLYIAVKDRKYRWETGYGIESTLNSALLGRISREYFVPNFQAGNYEQGILQAVDVAKRILLGSNDADVVALTNNNYGSQWDSSSSVIFIVIIAIFFLIIYAFYRNWLKKRNEWMKSKGKKKNDSFYHGAAWGLFAGGFGRGGFGGGGSGGFGGFSGGGGGFGGGGGSGGW